MTVAELREMLASFPDDLPVVFAYNSRDYWHTTVAASVNEVSVQIIRYSNYHQMNTVYNDEFEKEKGIEALVME